MRPILVSWLDKYIHAPDVDDDDDDDDDDDEKEDENKEQVEQKRLEKNLGCYNY